MGKEELTKERKLALGIPPDDGNESNEGVEASEPKKKEKKTLTYSDVKQYILGIDFKNIYSASRNDIIHKAEQNNAPEDVIDALLKLEDKSYYFYFQIQEAFNNIQWKIKTESEKKPIDKLAEQLERQKEACDSKNRRIKVLEERSLFYRMVGWGVLYILLVWIPTALLFVQSWITIASNDQYNIMNFQLGPNATKWVITDAVSHFAGIFLAIFMVVFLAIIYLFYFWIWLKAWDIELGD